MKLNLKFCKMHSAAAIQFVLAAVSLRQPDWFRDELLSFNTGGAGRVGTK